MEKPASFEIPAHEIATVEITSEQVARSRVPNVLAFGLLGLGAKASIDRGTVTVHMKNGETGYFSIYNASSAMLRGMMEPWLRARGISLAP